MCALHTLKVGKIMKIKKQDGPPEDLLYFDEEVDLTPSQVEDVVEIFNTPLTGSYNWD